MTSTGLFKITFVFSNQKGYVNLQNFCYKIRASTVQTNPYRTHPKSIRIRPNFVNTESNGYLALRIIITCIGQWVLSMWLWVRYIPFFKEVQIIQISVTVTLCVSHKVMIRRQSYSDEMKTEHFFVTVVTGIICDGCDVTVTSHRLTVLLQCISKNIKNICATFKICDYFILFNFLRKLYL